MRFLILATAILSAYSGIVGADPKTPLVVINNNGSYDRGTFPRKGVWLGLYCGESSCEIRNSDVRVTSSRKENIVGENEKTDELNVSDNPVALFHGVQLRPGPVTTWFRAEKQMYESSHYDKLRKLGHWQMPWGAKTLTISWEELPEYGGFRYHISDGAKKQFMFRTDHEGKYGGDTTPFIHWTGDLDGDGIIDLLISLPDDNCGIDDRLYLSSLALDGELLRKGAQLSGRKPACGC